MRYSARDLAAKRAQGLSIPLLLGSATPSLESLYNAKRNRYLHLQLITRAGGAKMPSFHIIDMRNENVLHGLSDRLINVIRKHLAASGQVLIYLNRRGFAPTVLCQSCGWQEPLFRLRRKVDVASNATADDLPPLHTEISNS